MSIKTFLDPTAAAYTQPQGTNSVSTSAMVAAMKAPGAQAAVPTFAAAPAPAAPAATAPMSYDSPASSSLSQALIDNALSGRPIGHPLEGVGRLAQLVSGHYGKAQDDKRLKDRETATSEYLAKNIPELADPYRLGGSQERAEIAKQARAIMMQRHEQGRQRQQNVEDFKALDAAGSDEEKLRSLAATGNARAMDLYAQAVQKRMGAKSDAEKADLEARKVEAREQAKAASRVQALVKAGYTEQEASAIAAGVNPDVIEKRRDLKANGVGKYFDEYDSAVGNDKTYGPLLAAAKETHKANMKSMAENYNTAVRGLRSLEQVEAAMRRGAYTGFGGEQVLQLKQIGESLGMKFGSRASDGEIIQAVSLELAKGARAGFAGSVSNYEMGLYMKAIPGLMNTPEGNRLIIDVMKDTLQGHVDITKDYADWRKMRAEKGKPGLAAEGFEAFARDRAEERRAAFSKRIEETVTKHISDQNAKKTTPYLRGDKALPGNQQRIDLNGKQYMRLDNGQYVEVR
jgi:hypothetical protein